MGLGRSPAQSLISTEEPFMTTSTLVVKDLTIRGFRFKESLGRWDVTYSPYLFISPFFILFALVGLFPLLYTGWVSLHAWDLLGGQGRWTGFDNFGFVLHQRQFWVALRNTLSIFLLSAVPQILAATAAHAHLRDHHRHHRRPPDLRRAAALRPERPRWRGPAVDDDDHLPVQAGLAAAQFRPRRRRRVAAVSAHHRDRAGQPGDHAKDRDQRRSNGMSVLSGLKLRRAEAKITQRPGALVYGFLTFILVASVFPFYWSFLIGTMA